MPSTAARAALLAAGLGAAALAACGPADRAPEPDAAVPVTVRDRAGRTVGLERPARRVVSLIPGVTDLVLALGAADRLVARTDFDRDPRIARLPSVGQGLTPSLEWIAAREPDLVFAWPDNQSRNVVGRLESLGVPVYRARIETLDDMRATLADVGHLLGLDAAADSAARAIDAGLLGVRAAAPDSSPAVLYLVGLDPPFAAGEGTFIDELIAVAGGTNALAGTRGWPQLAVEDVLARQPAVIVVSRPLEAGDPLADLRRRPGWRDLEAVRAGRVHAVDPDRFNRAGPGVVDAARGLARRIHGGPPDGPAPDG